MPRHWHAPRPWLYQAWCLHDGMLRDSHGQHLYRVGSGEGAWPTNSGNSYFGGLQFLPSTWRRAGGAEYTAFSHPGDPRYPFTASPREQLYRAWIIWRSHNGSWSEWGDMRPACHLS